MHHLDLNVLDLARSEAFYREVLGRLGFREFDRGPGWVSLGEGSFYVTLVQTSEAFTGRGFHRKAAGVNHLAFPAPDQASVDGFHRFLVERGVPVLYGGPMDMADGDGDGDGPNYAVFFEDPDRLKLEYVYRPLEEDPAAWT